MFLSIIGIAFVIIATYFVYKNATDYGRNAPIWALITFVVGIGLQWVFPIILMIILSVVLLVTGSSQMQAQSSLMFYAGFIGIGSLVLSGVVVLLILKFVSKMPEEKTFVKPPSPPTSF